MCFYLCLLSGKFVWCCSLCATGREEVMWPSSVMLRISHSSHKQYICIILLCNILSYNLYAVSTCVIITRLFVLGERCLHCGSIFFPDSVFCQGLLLRVCGQKVSYKVHIFKGHQGTYCCSHHVISIQCDFNWPFLTCYLWWTFKSLVSHISFRRKSNSNLNWNYFEECSLSCRPLTITLEQTDRYSKVDKISWMKSLNLYPENNRSQSAT